MIRAVIIANKRTGGTFLSWCLSNHPNIHCERGEILHPRHPMRAYMVGSNLEWIKMILSAQFYQVSMCKLVYDQALVPDIWNYLCEIQPHIVWLRRENLLRQAVSLYLAKFARRIHSYADPPAEKIQIETNALIATMAGLEEYNQTMEEALGAMEHVLPVTYAEITGTDNASEMNETAGRRVCAFLGVSYYPMRTALKRVNPFPLCETLSNWTEIETALKDTRFSAFLDGNE